MQGAHAGGLGRTDRRSYRAPEGDPDDPWKGMKPVRKADMGLRPAIALAQPVRVSGPLFGTDSWLALYHYCKLRLPESIDDRCRICNKSAEEAGVLRLSKCSACVSGARYCGRDCQVAHWKEHKRGECMRFGKKKSEEFLVLVRRGRLMMMMMSLYIHGGSRHE